MKELKDYLPYYIGSPVFLCNNLEGNPVIEPLTSKMLHEDEEMFTDPENGPYRLLLRRLSDMTEQERIEYTKRKSLGHDGVHHVLVYMETPESFHYLLKQGFDLFNLIDNNLAEDAKTLNKQQ